jgi:hypothetical protein
MTEQNQSPEPTPAPAAKRRSKNSHLGAERNARKRLGKMLDGAHALKTLYLFKKSISLAHVEADTIH